jgi:hypothetical protein
MAEMTKSQRARWRNRMRKAGDALDTLRHYLEAALEVCPVREPGAHESKQEECEALAADAVRDALGAAEGVKGLLGEAWTQYRWEEHRAQRDAGVILARAFAIACTGCGAAKRTPCSVHPVACAERVLAGKAAWDAEVAAATEGREGT